MYELLVWRELGLCIRALCIFVMGWWIARSNSIGKSKIVDSSGSSSQAKENWSLDWFMTMRLEFALADPLNPMTEKRNTLVLPYVKANREISCPQIVLLWLCHQNLTCQRPIMVDTSAALSHICSVSFAKCIAVMTGFSYKGEKLVSCLPGMMKIFIQFRGYAWM